MLTIHFTTLGALGEAIDGDIIHGDTTHGVITHGQDVHQVDGTEVLTEMDGVTTMVGTMVTTVTMDIQIQK